MAEAGREGREGGRGPVLAKNTGSRVAGLENCQHHVEPLDVLDTIAIYLDQMGA